MEWIWWAGAFAAGGVVGAMTVIVLAVVRGGGMVLHDGDWTVPDGGDSFDVSLRRYGHIQDARNGRR